MSTPRSVAQSRAGIPSFEEKLENEEEVVDAFLKTFAKNELDPDLWTELHQAAVRFDRVSELAFAYESTSQGRKLRTLLPAVQAELFFRAATFFGDVLGDEFGAATYLEKALTVQPGHAGAFERIDAQLTRTDDAKKLAELCVATAPHRQRPEQIALLERAAHLFERAGLEDRAIETYQLLVRLAPSDESLRDALEQRYVRANRFRDVARMLEQALGADPPLETEEALRVRGKLIDVFANQLKEPERAMPHVEVILEADPTNPEARRVATRLLESKGLAARAAAALSPGAATSEERARFLAVELENTRGPKRQNVLRRIGVLKQDELGDAQGAFEAFEQALGIDPADDDLRRRYVELGVALKGPAEVARTFARVSTVAKDAGVRSRITAEMGELLLRGGDAKRARTTLAGVLAATTADPHAVLTAARALAGVYEGENDAKQLVEVLARIGEQSPDEAERQSANERVAELATNELHDVERAIAAWRRLVDTPARPRALAALEPLYEERCEWIDLSFVLEERAKDEPDRVRARALSFQAAEVLTTKAKDVTSAHEAWRHMVETYGPARDVFEQWMPLLEQQRMWPELAEALAKDAELAPREERPAILARLGVVYLQRTKEVDLAIEAFQSALLGDPQEKTSRTTLEKLLLVPEHRVAAGAVLEPVYRREDNAQGLLRVLEIRASSSPIVPDRLAALEEAADVAGHISRDKALEIVARGLGEAIESGEPITRWLTRFDVLAADGLDAKRRAALLAKALGDREIDSVDLLSLARRVGEENAAAGDVAAALAAYRRALAFEPSSIELINRVDALLQEQGNPEERVALYRAALERGPDPARRRQLLHSIGSIERYELLNPDAAILAYNRALRDAPDDPEAFTALAELYRETEAWDRLCDILEEHLAHCRTSDEARATRAELAHVAAMHGQESRGALHAGALLGDADVGSAELDLIEEVAAHLGDTALLRAVLERRVRDSADARVQVQSLERLADLAKQAGDRSQAVERLRQAAGIASGLGEDAQAVALLTRLREIDPNDAAATAQLVELHERSEAFDQVPDLYAVLLEVAPSAEERVALLRRLSAVRADRLDDLRGAFEATKTAFDLAPQHQDVLAELVDLAVRTEQGGELAATVDRALEGVGEDDTSLWAGLTLAKARVLAAMPELWEDARKAYRSVLERSDDDAQRAAAAEGFADLLRAMPPSTERTADLRWLHGWRVEHAKPEDRARATYAWAVVEENDIDDPIAALGAYRKVLELDENDLDSLAAVSRLSLAQGDIEGALSALIARRTASEGEARNALDVQIATILAARPGRAAEALDRVAGVLESAPHDTGALDLAARLLQDPDVAPRAAEVLEKSLDAVDSPEDKIRVFEQLVARAPRRDLYERYFDTAFDLGRPAVAYDIALRGGRDLPGEPALWDRAENVARQLSSPEPLADTYEDVLRRELPTAQCLELGQRAVAFYEEWYEDNERVIRVLERLLDIAPDDGWAFDRLKLIFDAAERWEDLFKLFDRAAKGADRDRRIELFEEAAQIAKDFANHPTRAIGYLEQLLELKPGNARLAAALERLYERHGCHRELITLLGSRLDSLPLDEAQRERSRIAALWLEEIGDTSNALRVIEDILEHQPEGEQRTPSLPPREPGRASLPPPPLALDVTQLLERVLAVAPSNAEVRASVFPASADDAAPTREGRRDSYAPKRMLVRQRAAALLKERYMQGGGHEADLVRVLEVELEAVKSVKERIRRHHQIAGIYAQLGNDDAAMEHLVHLVLLEPEVTGHRSELATIAERTARFDRFADVLVSAADDQNDDTLRIELLMQAGVVTSEKIGDVERAIELFFRVLHTSPIADSALLEACRHVEPLLAQTERREDRLDVLEKLATLEQDPHTRWEVLGAAARLAMEQDEDDRAIWAWQGRLEAAPLDPEALDGLAFLFERGEHWRLLIDVLDKRASLGARDEADRRRDRVRVAGILGEKLDAVEEAIATWRDIEETFGPSEDGTRELASLYRGTRRWKELAELLAAAAERAPTKSDEAEVLRELGDVQREQLDDAPRAITSYEAALTRNPRSEGARGGLRTLLRRSELREDVVRVLLGAYVAADDWRLILDLTEHRLAAAKDAAAQVAVLMEAARISESRAEDLEAAFALVRRALLLDPSAEQTVSEIFRLADATRAWRPLADALRECIESPEGRAGDWARALRFRMGDVLEAKLDEPRAALDAYVHVAQQDPNDLEPARAVIRVAGRTGRWDAAARAVVDATAVRGELDSELLAALEESAGTHAGWDAITFATASLVNERAGDGSLEAHLARDLESAVAGWHRDRRGDPEAAEAAFTRALAHDPSNPTLLADLAQLQRRVRGRPLVDSLLRLSQTTGGDLDLLSEAAETALGSVGDRALAKSILDRMLKLGAERWLGATEPNVTSGTPAAPEAYIERATRDLVRLWSEDGDHDKVVQLLVDISQLPWRGDEPRRLRHEAARVAVDKLGAPDRAVGIYLALIEDDPHDDEAVTRLAAIYESAGRRSELLELKKRLVGTARTLEERLGLRLDIARLEDAVSNVERAVACLQENLADSPRHDDTVKELVTLLTRDGRVAELESILAGQAKLADDEGDATLASDLYARAAEVAETRMNDLPRAIGHLRRVVEIDPRPAALDALARLSTATRDHEAAAGYLDRLREASDNKARADVVLRLADALVAAGRKPDARQKLEDEIRRDPEADRVRVRLAEVYRAAQDWPALAELLTDGATHAPDKATRFARLREAAELHRERTGEPERAIPLLEQAVDLSPDENPVKLALADALGAAGRFEEARTLLRTLVEAFGGRRPKERAPVHFYLARLDLALGDRARALVELDAATKIDPANAQILRALAELARDDGQLDRAERSYRALLTVLRRLDDVTEDAAITRSEVLFELSRIAHRQGEPERAQEIIESAFELAAETVVEARRLEGALRNAGEHLHLARALESRLARGSASDEAAIYAELGRLYDTHLAKPDEAFEMWMRALDIEPDLDETHDALYRISKALGRVEDYEGRVRGLAGKHEADVELAASLFVRLARMAELDRRDDVEAARLYEKAVEIHPRSREILVSLSAIYERLGDDRGQARVLGALVELDAEDGGASPDALFRLAQLRFGAGEIDAACEAFEQAYDREPSFERGEQILRAAADAHPEAARVLDAYERMVRAAHEEATSAGTTGHERSLVDALSRRWMLPGSSTDAIREAVEIADRIEDKELAESLLRRFLEKEHDDTEGRVWALSLLAFHCETSGNVREAVLLKREAAEIAEATDARRLLFEVAGLASGPLGDLHLAGTIYEELHEKEPTDRDAWELLLDVYRRTNDFDKLVSLIQDIVQYVDDPAERSRLRLERVKTGMEKLGLSDEDATTELREIVDDDPSAVDAAILLGSILERSGRAEDLAELLGKQLDAAKDREDGDAVSSLSRRLGELLEETDRAQAKDVYYTALDWDPKAKNILVALERLHDADAEIEARSDVMEKRLALESGTEAETLALSLAETRRSLDDAAGALRALEVGFSAYPSSSALKERLETIYREQLEFEKLASLYEVDARARSDAKQKATRLRDAAQIWRDELANPGQASRVLREAREAAPGDPLLLGELVDTLTASGELKTAAAELTSAIESLGEDDSVRADLLGRRAILRSHLNDHDAALADFDEAIARGKLDLRPYLAEHLGKMALAAAGRGDAAAWRAHRMRVAELRLAMNDIEEARTVLTELLKNDSKDRATLRAIAHVDELEERWDAASATYRRLVGLEEGAEVVAVALKLAETCAKADRLADARGGLERARAAAPDNEELRDRLKWLYEQLGAMKELAELLLEEARAAGDVAPRFEGLVRAGQLFLQAASDPNQTAQFGAAGAAIAPLEEAHALRPSDLDCAALLSDAYASAGRVDEAQELLLATIGTFKGRRARELSALYHRLARIAEFGGDKEAAIAQLVTALEMDSQNGVVASELAYVAMETGNLEVAQRALRQITMQKAPAPLPKALAYQHLGEIAQRQGDNKRAMMLLKRAIDEDPNLDTARAIIDALQAEA